MHFHMVKGIINAFDHMELHLVIKLTLGVTRLVYGHQYLLLGILVLLLPFIPGSNARYLVIKLTLGVTRLLYGNQCLLLGILVLLLPFIPGSNARYP